MFTFAVGLYLLLVLILSELSKLHSAPVSILLANISISVTRIFVYKLMPTVSPALAHKSFYRVVRDKFIFKSNHVRWGDVKYKPC